MADTTDFLSLTLPSNGEFLDTWDTPLNANFETLDDHLKTLAADLVGAGGDTADLGTPDLKTRLDNAMDATGALDLSGNATFAELENSRVYTTSLSSDALVRVLDRLDKAEQEIARLRLATTADRYGNAITPDAVTGLARVAAQYSSQSLAIHAPIRGFTANSVVQGPQTAGSTSVAIAPTHLVSSANTEVHISTASGGVFYNIDGFPLSVTAGDWYLDFSGSGHSADIAGGAATYYLWVSRNEADYNTTGNLNWWYNTYNGQAFGGVFQNDPRIVPTHASLRASADDQVNNFPSDGTISAGTSVFTSATAAFSTWGVQAGDVLVITSPTSLVGEYPIKSVDSDNQLTIFGEFRAAAAGTAVHWVKNSTVPAFGFSSSLSPAAGRVYIGQFDSDGSGNVNTSTVIPYAYNGIYDTGWLAFDQAFGTSRNYYLGVAPTWITYMVQTPGGDHYINPWAAVNIEHVDEQGGSTYQAFDIPVPTFNTVFFSTQQFRVNLYNPDGDQAVFWDFNGTTRYETDATYLMRFIMGR